MSSSSLLNDYIAGAVGGMTGLVFGHPLDTTKVQGLFRGMAFPLVSYGVINSIFFGVYGNTLAILQKKKVAGQETVSYGQIYLAGCAGGAAQLVVACPVDVVKVVLQSQIPSGSGQARGASTRYFHGATECAKWVYQQKGMKGCYRGMVIMALRDIPTFGIYTFSYESLYLKLSTSGLLDRQGVLASLISGGFAGCSCWFFAMPFDVVKSVVQAETTQTKYSGLLDCARQLYQTNGVRGFFTGLQVSLVRAFVVNSITFLFYSKSLQILNNYNVS